MQPVQWLSIFPTISDPLRKQCRILLELPKDLSSIRLNGIANEISEAPRLNNGF